MKALRVIEGNLLLNWEVDVVGHQANCQNTFGSGIARSILEMYPEAYEADTLANELKHNVLGNISVGHIAKETAAKYGTKISQIYNLYGQCFFSRNARQTNYEALYQALEKMRAYVPDSAAVGFPYKMGSDRGGGSWDVVERLIEVAFDGYSGEIIIVRLTP